MGEERKGRSPKRQIKGSALDKVWCRSPPHPRDLYPDHIKGTECMLGMAFSSWGGKVEIPTHWTPVAKHFCPCILFHFCSSSYFVKRKEYKHETTVQDPRRTHELKFISYGCCNKWPQTPQLKTAQSYYLTVQEVQGEKLFPDLPQTLQAISFLGLYSFSSVLKVNATGLYLWLYQQSCFFSVSPFTLEVLAITLGPPWINLNNLPR